MLTHAYGNITNVTNAKDILVKQLGVGAVQFTILSESKGNVDAACKYGKITVAASGCPGYQAAEAAAWSQMYTLLACMELIDVELEVIETGELNVEAEFEHLAAIAPTVTGALKDGLITFERSMEEQKARMIPLCVKLLRVCEDEATMRSNALNLALAITKVESMLHDEPEDFETWRCELLLELERARCINEDVKKQTDLAGVEELASWLGCVRPIPARELVKVRLVTLKHGIVKNVEAELDCGLFLGAYAPDICSNVTVNGRSVSLFKTVKELGIKAGDRVFVGPPPMKGGLLTRTKVAEVISGSGLDAGTVEAFLEQRGWLKEEVPEPRALSGVQAIAVQLMSNRLALGHGYTMLSHLVKTLESRDDFETLGEEASDAAEAALEKLVINGIVRDEGSKRFKLRCVAWPQNSTFSLNDFSAGKKVTFLDVKADQPPVFVGSCGYWVCLLLAAESGKRTGGAILDLSIRALDGSDLNSVQIIDMGLDDLFRNQLVSGGPEGYIWNDEYEKPFAMSVPELKVAWQVVRVTSSFAIPHVGSGSPAAVDVRTANRGILANIKAAMKREAPASLFNGIFVFNLDGKRMQMNLPADNTFEGLFVEVAEKSGVPLGAFGLKKGNGYLKRSNETITGLGVGSLLHMTLSVVGGVKKVTGYLPKSVWEAMTPEERLKHTSAKKTMAPNGIKTLGKEEPVQELIKEEKKEQNHERRERPKHEAKSPESSKVEIQKALTSEGRAERKAGSKHMDRGEADIVEAVKSSRYETALKPSVKRIQNLMRSIVLPEERKNCRWAADDNMTPTVAVTSAVKIPAPWGLNSDSAAGGMPNNQMLMVLTRDPCHALIFSDFLSATAGISYGVLLLPSIVVSGKPNALTSTPNVPNQNASLFLSQNGAVYPNCPYAVPISGAKPHGEVFYPYISTDEPGACFFWCDYQAVVTVALNPGSANTNVQVNLDAWENGAVEQSKYQLVFNLTNAGQTITAVVKPAGSAGGYLALRLVNQTASVAVTCAAGITQTSGLIMAHRSMPDLHQNAASVGSIRVIGNALKFTSTGQELYKGGKIVMARYPAGSPWTQCLGADPFTAVSNFSSASPIEIGATGGYMWHKPGSTEEMFMVKPFKCVNGIIESVTVDIDKIGASYVMVAALPVPTEQDQVLTLTIGAEFTTNNNWMTAELAKETAEECQISIHAVERIGTFYDNPDHVDDLEKSVGGAWNWLKGNFRGVMNSALGALMSLV